MIKSLFQWLDATPGIYWLIGCAGTLAPLAWTVWQWRRSIQGGAARSSGLIAALLLVTVVFAWRWPALLEVRAVSVAEARLIAGALTLERDPMPFRSLDMAVAGPLGALFLLPTHLLGVRQDYFNARLLALLFDCGALVMGFICLSRAYSRMIAMLGLLPLALVFSVTGNAEVAGYSTAHPLLFMSTVVIGIYWGNLSSADQNSRGARFRWLMAGLGLGLLPWINSRGAALALGLWFSATVVALVDAPRPWSQRLKGAAWSGGSALYFGALILALLHGIGSWEDFWKGFVRWDYDPAAGLAVGSANGVGEIFARAPGLWLGLLATIGLRIFWRGQFQGNRSGRSWLVVGLALAASMALGWGREESAGWLILGGAALAIGSVVALGESLSAARNGRTKVASALIFTVAAVGGQGVVLLRSRVPEIFGHFADYWRHPRSELSQLINGSQLPGDTLAVWGCGPQFHVETGLAQAVRPSCTLQELAETAHRDTFFRPRYLADLQRNKPAYFIDATGAREWADRGRYGHEEFPQLGEYIRENYRLARDDQSARLYVRLNRQIAVNLAEPDVDPVGLDRLHAVKVFSRLEDIGDTRIMAHAPSTLTCPIPLGARRLRGVCGIVPAAYVDPARATSGAHFIVNVLGPGEKREMGFSRWLRPLTVGIDRGPIEFEVAIPDGAVAAIEFSIEVGASNAFAWTYWGELRFEGKIGLTP